MTLIGRTFDRWTVIGWAARANSVPSWLCRCECGTERIVVEPSLKYKYSRSCGCLMRDVNSGDPRNLEEVVQVVSDVTGVSIDDLRSPSRVRPIAWARQTAMLAAREFTKASTPQIAAALGRQDHTTILYGIEEARKRVEEDPTYRRIYRGISAGLRKRGIGS